jgi:hypothetical protein
VKSAVALIVLLSGRAAVTSGPESWLENRYGRFDVDRNASAIAEIGIDWTPSPYFLAHVHAIGRQRESGLVEGYAQAQVERGNHRVQLRAGQFFLPTSRENRDQLWASPYTINFSAWNSWIAQEVRPIGADLEWRVTTSSLNRVTLGATAFRGNDTMGALIAWRGWTVGNHLAVYDEAVPLPHLPALAQFIPAQRRDGTTAFTRDLDGQPGFAARGRFAYADRGMVQLTHVDNGGDNEIYGDEYSWDTAFDVLALEVGSSEFTVLAIEAARGRTSMGRIIPETQPRRYANVGFTCGYALVSHKRNDNRFSARLDAFRNEDRDGSPGENNDEDGLAWTLAYFRDVTPRVRAGLEFTQVIGDRPAAAESGFDANVDGRSLTGEIRFRY